MKRIAVTRELGCIVGNLFEGLEPPCDIVLQDGLTLRGRSSVSGKECMLTIHENYVDFEGDEADLDAVLNGKCPEKRCKNVGK